jgi:hypothetical protein
MPKLLYLRKFLKIIPIGRYKITPYGKRMIAITVIADKSPYFSYFSIIPL